MGDARERMSKPLSSRESWVAGFSTIVFIAASLTAWSLIDVQTSTDPLVIGSLVVLYAVFSRIEFEVGPVYQVPEQLVLVPMLFLVPLPLVPLLVVTGFLLSDLPDYIRGTATVNRSIWCFHDAMFVFGPVAVLAMLNDRTPDLAHWKLYLGAFAAQVLVGAVLVALRESFANRVPVTDALQGHFFSARVDAVLSPIGLMVAMQAVQRPGAIAAVVPLAWLLFVFSQERKERHGASIELNQAYRGTVMLLTDVVESEDNYTAEHCRSVVELVTDVADKMKIPSSQRQELEFAALLHDVGKIAIPKEILNKPAKLTDEEFELIKTHTIEGQHLLDRVGGLLGRVGEIVRSCHERWDGKGYPDGLGGEEIPLPARIVFCCDAYNAMTTDRPYRKAMSREDAVAELRGNSGTQFDPQVVIAVERVVMSSVQYPYLAHAQTTDAVAATIAATSSRAKTTVAAG